MTSWRSTQACLLVAMMRDHDEREIHSSAAGVSLSTGDNNVVKMTSKHEVDYTVIRGEPKYID